MVLPIVVVPNKGCEWRACVEYRELIKSTQKYHFLFMFIDNVLSVFSRNKYFLFLDSFNGYNQIQIAPNGQDKMTFT